MELNSLCSCTSDIKHNTNYPAQCECSFRCVQHRKSNFCAAIWHQVLIFKVYNLAHMILALWPFRLLRAFLEKWCVSIKSVCYFNSALLWWFEVRTVEINYQSQSRQLHGSCYRLRNWSVMNIHLPTAISCSSEYSDSSNYPKCWINSNFYMNCWLCLTIRKT